MCGGAILSDIIAPSTGNRSRRLTAADLFWNSDLLKTSSNNYFSKPLRSDAFDVDDEFEADFQGFKDQVEIDDVDINNNNNNNNKPSAFNSASKHSSPTPPPPPPPAPATARGNFYRF